MNTFREALAFCTMGAVLPCLFLAMTGTPSPFYVLTASWIVFMVTKPRKRDR